MKKVFLFIVFFLTLFTCFSFALTDGVASTQSWIVIQNDLYSIKVPRSWMPIVIEGMDSDGMKPYIRDLESLKCTTSCLCWTSSDSDGMFLSVQGYRKKENEDITIEEIVKQTANYNEGKPIWPKAGQKRLFQVVDETIMDKGHFMTEKSRKYYLVQQTNDAVYIVVVSCREKQIKNVEECENTVLEILNSFNIK